MIVAAHQPHYLPWSGYFDKMDRVDAFILLDTVQFKKNEWQNRNRFRTPEGWHWVTVPVRHDHGQTIAEVRIDPDQPRWAHKHEQALRTDYGAAAHSAPVLDRLSSLWDRSWELLCDLNIATVEALADLLDVATPRHLASRMESTPDDADDRLISLCRQLGADAYLAGPDGPSYMDMERWEGAGIRVEVQEFVHPEYPQAFAGFEPGLSVVDLICNCGPEALPLLRRANGRER
jgi:hypothetical protein